MANTQEIRDVLTRAIEIRQAWTAESNKLANEAIEALGKADQMSSESDRDIFKRVADRLLASSEAARQGAEAANAVIGEATALLHN